MGVPNILEIVNQYNKLSTWCGDFWSKVYSKYSGDIACNAGCPICCELQSVNLLEAFVMYRSLKTENRFTNDSKKDKCVFLVDDKCSVYKVRPLICRTHGLAIKSREFIDAYSITCPYNFQNTDLDKCKNILLDMDMITENMMKLNYAFCIVNECTDLAQDRVLLYDIASGILPERIAHVFESSL